MSTYRQLKQQIAELEKKATIAIKKEARTVIERIKQQIAEFGLTAADLGLEIARRAAVKTRAKRTKRVLTPKYREPTTGKTWNGHGKRPGWIVAAQKKGKLEELLIAKPALARVAPQAKAAKKSAAKKTGEEACGGRGEETCRRAQGGSDEAGCEQAGCPSQEASACRDAGNAGPHRGHGLIPGARRLRAEPRDARGRCRDLDHGR